MAERDLRYDVLVIGGGPAGVAAATTAAECGVDVALIESTPWLGGPVWRPIEGRPPTELASTWFSRLDRAGVAVFTGATAFAANDTGQVMVELRNDSPDVDVRSGSVKADQGSAPRQIPKGPDASDRSEPLSRGVTMRFDRLILACGARERFLPFPGWTLPRVTGIGGLQMLVKGGWPLRGRRVVVAGSGPLLLAAAAHFVEQGADVVEVVEQARRRAMIGFVGRLSLTAPGKLRQAFELKRSLAGIRYRTGGWVTQATGSGGVEHVQLTDGRRVWEQSCDYLACAFGLIPNLRLPRILGCRCRADGVVVDAYQRTTVDAVFAVGESTGIAGIDLSVTEGEIAGAAAAGKPTAAQTFFPRRKRQARFAKSLDRAFALRRELKNLVKNDTIVCRCEDVTWAALSPCESSREAKLQTRCGMGACQGRICQPILEHLKGWTSDRVRPPVFPVAVSTMLDLLQEGLPDDAESIEAT